MSADENSEKKPLPEGVSEPDAMLLEQLGQLGVNLGEKRIIEYGFVASSLSDAEALCLCLQDMGHEFVDMPGSSGLDDEGNDPAFDEDRAGIWIESSELITPLDAAAKTTRLQLLASEFNCKYDGWGTCVDNQPTAE
ncbi:MAG: ribonuclease E inhibitor RraB [Cyanobacteria bacterium SZAS LIN-2]|nr:ribonuclease E inhibitor RraB [Cyanobacteria bacterium SZAS LIN-3]MBS1996429.1 ribonuclease E inhibitor RraB [Cyanobacteria bacterium SZAS LIN-2]MBS2005451.1 ribonuclease E inhibitor RraB [Cyanobacteria bacterium SZAS TMP-1]